MGRKFESKGCYFYYSKRVVTSVIALGVLMLSAFTILLAYTPLRANAVTMQDYNRKVQSNAALRKQLAGVSKQLADKILELNDINEHQIPNQIRAAQQAQDQAQQAMSLVESTNQRLQSAQKDKRDLEEKIKKTGEDFDDAKAAVAQLARKSFHGSNASNVMAMVTNSTTTEQFVGKLQSEAAVVRSEANAANDAAVTLNNSMNRRQRLAAIEDEIQKLKQKAQDQAQSAQAAAKAAVDKQRSLQNLRDQGSVLRKQLESQKNSLTSRTAREATEIVALKSQIDAQARALAASAAARMNPNANRQQMRGGGWSAP